MRRIRDRMLSSSEDPRRLIEAMDRANIPSRYRQATVDAIKQPQLRKWARDTMDNPGPWLGAGLGFLMVGQLRSGKSCLAGLLAMDAVVRCEVVLWLAAREIPGVMFRDGERNAELHQRLLDADLLVIDDLGAEGYSMARAGGSALEGAMRTIYDAQRSLIVTSNLGDGALRGKYPDAVVSVLERMTSVLVVENGQWPAGPGMVALA